ncbi:polysaccharide pyruvyl transferase family protein [Vibrio hyugaensis]|uniref:polysaccharide pyruvyl transferase family protein n=1 Tax=Vibrio hyugaensis TaxID=1534743 RepID=UPI003D9FBD41
MKELQSAWLDTMSELKGLHTEIATLIDAKSIAYIDIPIHFNVGDLLIYKGTEQFFQNHGINVLYRSDCHYVDQKKLEKVDVIVFHGGGNFGDIYPLHQKFRESIVSKYPEKRIICLPQTIKFKDLDTKKESSKIFEQHNDFHMFVRDERSYEEAKLFTENVRMMPDMAHSLHPMIDKTEITNRTEKLLNLVRKDVEANSAARTNKRDFDWDDIISVNDILIGKSCNIIRKLSFMSSKANGLYIKLWERASNDIIFRSVNYFNIHDQVHTDRLHGLILASLLGKNIKLYDNSYGKNVSYYDFWLKNIELIHLEK